MSDNRLALNALNITMLLRASLLFGFGFLALIYSYVTSKSCLAWLLTPNTESDSSLLFLFSLVSFIYLYVASFAEGICHGVLLNHLLCLMKAILCFATGYDATLVLSSIIILDSVHLPHICNIVSYNVANYEIFRKFEPGECAMKNPAHQMTCRDGKFATRIRNYKVQQRKRLEGITSASDSDGTHLRPDIKTMPIYCAQIPIFIMSRIVYFYFAGHIVMQFATSFLTKMCSILILTCTICGILRIFSHGNSLPRFLCHFRIY